MSSDDNQLYQLYEQEQKREKKNTFSIYELFIKKIFMIVHFIIIIYDN